MGRAGREGEGRGRGRREEEGSGGAASSAAQAAARFLGVSVRRGGWGGSRGARAGEGVTGPAMADNEKLDNQRLKNFKNKGRDLEVNSGTPERWGPWTSGGSPPGLRVWGVGAGAAAGPRGNGAGGWPARDASAEAPGSLCRAWSASAGARGARARPARPRPARRSRSGAGARGRAMRRGGRARQVRRKRASAALPRPRCGPHPAAAEIPALAPAPASGAAERSAVGGGGRGRRACGDRVGLGTSLARPEASPLKGIFSGLPDSRFTLPPPNIRTTGVNFSVEKNTPDVRGHPGDANSAFLRPVFYYGYS